MFWWYFVLSLCLFDISVHIGALVIGLNQISTFFSYYNWICTKLNFVNNHWSCFKYMKLVYDPYWYFLSDLNVYPHFFKWSLVLYQQKTSVKAHQKYTFWKLKSNSKKAGQYSNIPGVRMIYFFARYACRISTWCLCVFEVKMYTNIYNV